MRRAALVLLGSRPCAQNLWRLRLRGTSMPTSTVSGAGRICVIGRYRIYRIRNLLNLRDVDLLKPLDTLADIVATLLYPVTDRSFRELYEMACSWSSARRAEVIDVALRSRTSRDELLRNFRAAPYTYDIIMDIGAYRDLHRHRRCQQFRQAYSTQLGFETPDAIKAGRLEDLYNAILSLTFNAVAQFPVRERTICFLSQPAPDSYLKWIFPKPNISRDFAPASKDIQLPPNRMGNEGKNGSDWSPTWRSSWSLRRLNWKIPSNADVERLTRLPVCGL